MEFYRAQVLDFKSADEAYRCARDAMIAARADGRWKFEFKFKF